MAVSEVRRKEKNAVNLVKKTVLFTKGTGTLRMGVHYSSSSCRNQVTLLLSDKMRNAAPILHSASPGRKLVFC